jgi:phage tail-like protein
MATTDVVGELRVDPVRSFKFDVQAVGTDGDVFGRMGFMSIDGLAMNTDMVPYREGGFNTTPHKLPGQTDFAPLTLSSGVFYNRPQVWDLAKKMFAVNWGGGTLAMLEQGQISQYRYTLVVRVYAHPVTKGTASMSTRGDPFDGAVLAFKFVNCWTASVGFSGLNAQDNNILIHQMTVHHEGFDVLFGHSPASSADDPTPASYVSDSFALL